MELTTKRIYEPVSQEDGFRVLVDRLWPRGVNHDQAAIDLWAKDLAPSHGLRKWFSHTPERFPEFARRYRKELDSRSETSATSLLVAQKHLRITLLYAAKDVRHNQAVVLKQWLENTHDQVRSPDDSSS